MPTRKRVLPTLLVHKFGGAALADSAGVANSATIAAAHVGTPFVVVASATSGTTDALFDLARRASAGRRSTSTHPLERDITNDIDTLRRQHEEIVRAISGSLAESRMHAADVACAFDALTADVCALREADVPTSVVALTDTIVAHGERLSARVLTAALVARGVRAEYVDATNVIYTDGQHGRAVPDLALSRAAVERLLVPLLARDIVPVIPGFIGSGISGDVVTMGRGGSDLTATVLAAALGRKFGRTDVVLWKDVAGLMTADPRVVPDALAIPALNVREAAELAYHGAKVLHPRALSVIDSRTRVFIRSFADPSRPGTVISTARPSTAAARKHPVRALSVIGEQALVTVAGPGMVGVPGIAARVFTALERARISVSLISQASSEATICLAVARGAAPAARAALEEAFAPELARHDVDRIEIESDVATLAVVGIGMAGAPGVAARLFGALGGANVNVVAIAQGASEISISVILAERDAATAQRAVHDAFQLGKLGGGTAQVRTHADVVLLGFGKIGRELVAQIAALPNSETMNGAVRVVGAIDRGGYVFDPEGLSPRALKALAKRKSAGTSLGDVPGGLHGTATQALETIGAHALSRPILVDATASDTGTVLEAAVAYGMDLVLANKRPLADSAAPADALARSAKAHGRRVLHEATVGAGLPVIDTLKKLTESGDRILKIEGCPSGTMGYLFGALGRGTSFSEALRGAMRLGYTEPDPREDLSGMDVARKGLILGRLIGYTGSLGDLEVESLVPEPLRDIPLEAFLGRIEELDSVWAARVAKAKEREEVLRYRVTVTKRSLQVGIVSVPLASALGSLSGTDNQFAFTTTRYKMNPLVITGPGAGAAVTAAGILNDVLQLAAAR